MKNTGVLFQTYGNGKRDDQGNYSNGLPHPIPVIRHKHIDKPPSDKEEQTIFPSSSGVLHRNGLRFGRKNKLQTPDLLNRKSTGITEIHHQQKRNEYESNSRTEPHPQSLVHLFHILNAFNDNSFRQTYLRQWKTALQKGRLVLCYMLRTHNSLVMGVFSPTRWKTSAMLYFFPISVVVSK